MQSAKRYSNTNFTKRVDHEGGAKREEMKHASPAICSHCDAVYDAGRWTLLSAARPELKSRKWSESEKVICPACKQKQSGVAGGYVSISGEFFGRHREEITKLVANETTRAREANPLSAMIREYVENDVLKIETTTEHLAERIGHALKDAYDGETDFDFSHENKVVRVRWHRD
ncbi:MAG: BCAM0308 family protein [Pyrinomonadaceae bacterium]|nr:BCAM0308 family protein [Pyrinomonadaceae bacterium]